MNDGSAFKSNLAIFTTDFMGGGVGRMMCELAIAFVEDGHNVDLVVCDASGERGQRLEKAGVRIVTLARASAIRSRVAVIAAAPGAWRVLARPALLPLKGVKTTAYLPALIRYLRQRQPAALLSAKTECNLVALWARDGAGAATRIAVSERNMIGAQYRIKARQRNDGKKWGVWHKWRWRHLAPLMHAFYNRADRIIAISEAVASDLAEFADIQRDRIAIAPNPAFHEAIIAQSQQPVEHAWFNPGEPPVVLYVGRLSRQKNLETLLEAFARLVEDSARLVFIGGGALRDELQEYAGQLGIASRVDWIAHTENPFAYMARAGVFVLPSIYEGFGNVLVEAMGCGCPVIATDCPGAPSEILGHGRYGPVVPMRDPAALADAITQVLHDGPEPQKLVERAREFSVAESKRRYEDLMLGRRVDGAGIDSRSWIRTP